MAVGGSSEPCIFHSELHSPPPKKECSSTTRPFTVQNPWARRRRLAKTFPRRRPVATGKTPPPIVREERLPEATFPIKKQREGAAPLGSQRWHRSGCRRVTRPEDCLHSYPITMLRRSIKAANASSSGIIQNLSSTIVWNYWSGSSSSSYIANRTFSAKNRKRKEEKRRKRQQTKLQP